MSEQAVADATTPETVAVADAAPVEKAPAEDKNEIYSRIAESLNAKVDGAFEKVATRVKTKHNEEIHLRRVFGDNDGRNLVVTVFDQLLSLLLTQLPEGGIPEGKRTVGLPAGLGSLELLTAGATTKKTPQGSIIQVPRRWRIKWNTGKKIAEMLDGLPAPAEVPAAPAEVPAA